MGMHVRVQDRGILQMCLLTPRPVRSQGRCRRVFMAAAAPFAYINHPIVVVFQCPLVPKDEAFMEGLMLMPSPSSGNGWFWEEGRGGFPLGSAPPACS